MGRGSLRPLASGRDDGEGTGRAGNVDDTRTNGPAGTTGRRTVLYSMGLAPVVVGDVVSGIKGELSLWGQELDYFRRQNVEAARRGIGYKEKPKGNGRPVLPLDPELAQILLAAPGAALAADAEKLGYKWDAAQYEEDTAVLREQELDAFKEAGQCGTCSEGDLSDRGWFDFVSYCQYKAISNQVSVSGGVTQAYAKNMMESMHPGGTSASPTFKPPSPAQLLRISVGAQVLAEIRKDPKFANYPSHPLNNPSPMLEDFRPAVRSLLQYFRDSGYTYSVGIRQFGLSRDEYENHYVWTLGEPTFLKYWVLDEATKNGGRALQVEQGFSQDFVMATISAYLAECGVSVSSYNRFQSLNDPDLYSEQCTLRRQAPLPKGYDPEEFTPFVLDECNSANICY